MSYLMTFTMEGISLLSTMFVLAVGIVVLIVIVLFLIDLFQTKDAVRRNYPVIGRFRYLFSTLGEFFRQYFFAMDREEMPFNRAEREWVNKSSEGAEFDQCKRGGSATEKCEIGGMRNEFLG